MISGIGSSMDLSQMASMRSQKGNPFKKIDSNGDGSLDKSESVSMAEQISEMTGQSVDADEMFSDLDSDGDGLLSHEEFEAGRPQGPPPGMMKMMGDDSSTQSFLDMLSSTEESLDTNGDGIVSSQEAQAGMQSKIQQYQNQMTGNSLSNSLFDLSV